ncbi:calcium-activated chloride channel regulator 1-like [Glandiceps talaboti]
MMKVQSWAVFGVVVSFCCLTLDPVSSSLRRSPVTLKDNGYKGIVVAISNHVPDNETILQRIQDAFIEASQVLFVATNRRAYFKDITVLVPKSWSHRPEFGKVRTESFETANIIIDKANQKYGNTPYVKYMGGCGEMGEYIHLTSPFLIDKEFSERRWGPVGRLLVHEWAHLRWGVFDEYPTSGQDHANFYVSSSGKVEATRCPLEIHGSYINERTQNECSVSNVTGLPEIDCRFTPDIGNTSATASLMYMQFLPSVTSFCHNNDSDPSGFHNREAPNKHNRLCAGKSIWEVMSKSKDFINMKNPPVPEDTKVDTRPVFRFIQRRERRVVLVLDRSGSMEGRRLMKLRQAASVYIQNTVESGSYLGIVEFSDFAQLLAPMTNITDYQSRRDLVMRLPRVVGGWTCIGGAILKGIEVLSAGGQDPSGGILLVISDGGENRSPTIAEVLGTVEEAGIVIDTIAYSEQADKNLASLAADTGGMSFFYSGDDDSTALDDAFTTTVINRWDETTGNDPPIKLWSEAILIPAEEEMSGHVYIDSTVGNGTEFIFTHIDGRITVIVTSPNGSVFDQHYDGYSTDSEFKRVTIFINEQCESGKWLFNVRNRFYIQQVVTISTTSHSITREAEPILVTPKLSDNEIDYAITKKIAIFADISTDYHPVLNVNVTAMIDRPSDTTGHPGTNIPLQLHDNGAGSDIEKDDGVYSGYFFDFTVDGHYGVRITVDNENGQGKLGLFRPGQQALPLEPDAAFEEPNGTLEDVDPFNRVVSGGSFQLSNYERSKSEEATDDYSNEDMYTPSRITDLEIVSVSMETRDVTLTWTAPGDDLDIGKATFYDIRVGGTLSELYDDFENAMRLSRGDVIVGNLSAPKSAGSIETFVVRIPQSVSRWRVVISLRAVDDVGNAAEPSNVVFANFEFSDALTTTLMTTKYEQTVTERSKTNISQVDERINQTQSVSPTNTEDSRDSPISTESVPTVASLNYNRKSRTIWLFIGSGLALMAMIMVIITAFILYIRPNNLKKTKSKENCEISNPGEKDEVFLTADVDESQAWTLYSNDISTYI